MGCVNISDEAMFFIGHTIFCMRLLTYTINVCLKIYTYLYNAGMGELQKKAGVQFILLAI